MKWNNTAVRVFYIFSSVWTGFLIYFFCAAFAYGVVVMFLASSMVMSSVFVAWIGLVLLTAALITGVYGVFHGNDVHVTKVNVNIPSLYPMPVASSAVWKNRTAVWVSDIHLGHVRGSVFAKKVTDEILSLKPDIVFIGGDLYDGSKVDEAAIIEPLRALTDIDSLGQKKVPLGVYFIMGNHEEFNVHATARYAGAIKAIGIRILDDEMVTIDGLQIIGVDHGRTENRMRFISILQKITTIDSGHFDPKIPSILLKHEPRDLDVAARAGITFQISGHTHQGQIFPVSLVTKLTFKGFDYGLRKYTDSTGKLMQVYTSSGVGTWGPPLRVGTNSEIVLISFR